MGNGLRLGYVVKRYPRFSETFIVNEILAHERAGVPVHIFAVRRVNEPRFQPILGEVRAPVTYVSDSSPKADIFWSTLAAGAAALPDFWSNLDRVKGADVGDVQQAIQLAIAARNAGVTHFHAHFATIATRIAQLAAHFAGLRYSFTGHAKDLFHQDVDVTALRSRMADAAAVVTVSDFNLRWLRARHGAAARNVERIYNGLRLSDYPYRSPVERPRRILAVGRLVEKKGFATLVDACAILRSEGVAFDCEIIGDGPLEAELRSRIAALGLDKHVVLRGGLPRNAVNRSFAEAAVCALPCVIAKDGDRDGLPTVAIEAMALGTPCVATDVTGLPEIVRDGETGLGVAQNDPQALAAALVRLLDDPAHRTALAERARALVEAEFDVDRNAARLRQLFEIARSTKPLQLRAVG